MLVVDTSVAIKWAVPEEGSAQALDLIGTSLMAPDLFQAEVANVLTKKVRGREMSAEQAGDAVRQIAKQVTLLRSAPFGTAAFDLSLLLNHSVYDCYFLASAEAMGEPMVTADAVFVAKVRRTSRAAFVYLLGEEVPNV